MSIIYAAIMTTLKYQEVIKNENDRRSAHSFQIFHGNE